MKIIIDDKIPYIKEAAEKIADEVIYAPGKDFTRELIQDADALIIRTRTHCNRELLEGSKVKFIATATIGFDHIDTEYCKQAGIEWANAPGCNCGNRCGTTPDVGCEISPLYISRTAAHQRRFWHHGLWSGRGDRRPNGQSGQTGIPHYGRWVLPHELS